MAVLNTSRKNLPFPQQVPNIRTVYSKNTSSKTFRNPYPFLLINGKPYEGNERKQSASPNKG